jgi:hypothetical protein
MIGHESLISKPNDFFLTFMGEAPVILSRDAQGQLHALLNMCRHRGNRLVRSEMGNAKTFICPYHWPELMQFSIHEAWLLDKRQFHDWLDLFTDEVFYFMPCRRNVQRKELAQELREVGDLVIFEDDKTYCIRSGAVCHPLLSAF